MLLNSGLETTLVENPLDCKEIKPVNPKGNQSWIFIGRTDAEAEGPILWSSDEKNWLIGKDPDDGKDWRQEEKGTTEDEMVGWHHWLDGHEFEQAVGAGDRQGSLACWCLWGCTESDTTQATEHACMHWRRKWQPTPVFLPGESQEQRSLVGCRLWDRRVGPDWSDLAAAAATLRPWAMKHEILS